MQVYASKCTNANASTCKSGSQSRMSEHEPITITYDLKINYLR